jgi:hypothetical protein
VKQEKYLTFPSDYCIPLEILYSLWYSISVIDGWAHSSTVELPAHNRSVPGSNPGGPTMGE